MDTREGPATPRRQLAIGRSTTMSARSASTSSVPLLSPIDMECAASPLDSSFAEDDSDDTSMASVMTSDDASSIVDDDHFPPPRRSHPAPLLTPLLEKAATVEGATRRRSTASGSKMTDTTSVHEDEYGVEEVCRKCNGPGGENASAQRTLFTRL